MIYAACPTCKHCYEVRQTLTGREYFVCPNIQCPDYGAQDWVPEPLHEEITRDAFWCIAIVIAGALAWIGFDRVEGFFR
jgi:hypothetical protein